MNIVTCHVGHVTVETQQAMKKWDGPWDTYEIDPKDPFHYARIIGAYWSAGNDFCVIEPDIVPREDVFETLNTCECSYGCYPYVWLTHVGPALGCTWFRAPFLLTHQDAMGEVLRANVSWRQLDVVLMRHILARRRAQPHIHLPPVEHLNPYKQLQPGVDPTPMTEVPPR